MIKILIPAVGGQGGGVLTEWLFQAFLLEGFEAQGISLPGLSQRGGSTVYYIEAIKLNGRKNIIFSQHPVPGDVDVIVAQEFLELGRILEQGYGSGKTTVISSTHRIYSTIEKLPVGRGIYSDMNLHSIAEEFSSEFIGVNALELAKEHDMDDRAVNAILLGILCGAGCTPLGENSFKKAIEKTGIAVEANMKAFQLGLDYEQDNNPEKVTSGDHGYIDPALLDKHLISEKEKDQLEELAKGAGERIPVHLHVYMNEALTRLTDYQGIWYAEKFLNELRRIIELDRHYQGNDFRLTETCLKNLALLMSYEDGIRVAELKIRDSRFQNIKKEMSIKDDQIFHVIDYLKPDSEEIYGLLPNIIVAPVLGLFNTGIMKKILGRNRPFTFAQTPVTSSLSGFFMMWMLTKLKPLRPYSYRYKNEHSVIGKYMRSVEYYGLKDYELGLVVAEAGNIVKGYGRVRRRTVDTFHRFIDNVILRIYELENERGPLCTIASETGRRSLELISGEEDGIVKAEEMAERVLRENFEQGQDLSSSISLMNSSKR